MRPDLLDRAVMALLLCVVGTCALAFFGYAAFLIALVAGWRP